MSHDFVFWGLMIGTAGAFSVVSWLLFMLWRNANKGKDEDKSNKESR